VPVVAGRVVAGEVPAGAAETGAAVLVFAATVVGVGAGITGTGLVLTTIGAVLSAPARPLAAPLEMVGGCERFGFADGVSVYELVRTGIVVARPPVVRPLVRCTTTVRLT
jgi:hypothetical protein